MALGYPNPDKIMYSLIMYEMGRISDRIGESDSAIMGMNATFP